MALSGAEPAFSKPGNDRSRPLSTRTLGRRAIRLLGNESNRDIELVSTGGPGDLVIDGEALEGSRVLTFHELDRGVVLLLRGSVVLLLHILNADVRHIPDRFGLVGESEGITRVREEIQRVADLEVPVLLRSETGTGKELVARAIHQASQRRGHAFLGLNMGALPVSLATSELFGSTKGAFTGAVRNQAGYFTRAHGGTLFLDEIGDAPSEVQVMLLRVLESGEVQRVGSQEVQRVDVRLIAATDANLEAAIREGTFREPLLHRLSGYEISIPPLRERRDDLGRLLFHFLRQELRETGEEHRLHEMATTETPWLPASVIARLTGHRWPGNVRQLHNVARQLAVASRGSAAVRIPPQIERMLREAEAEMASWAAEPDAEVMAEAPEPAKRKRAPAAHYRKPSEVGEEELFEALRAHRWQLKPAAAELRISRPSLYALIEKSPRARKASDLERQEILESFERAQGDLERMVDELEVSKSGLQMKMKELEIG